MPFVEIKLWKGRDERCRKELIEGITDVCEKVVGCPRHAVEVVIDEVDKSNWGMGGVPASDIHPDK